MLSAPKTRLGKLGVLAFSFLLAEKSSLARWDLVPGSRYTSARAAAMGDAFLPLGEDGSAGLFYNPATLAKPTPTTLEIFNLSLYGNLNYLGSLDGNFYKITNLSGFLP